MTQLLGSATDPEDEGEDYTENNNDNDNAKKQKKNGARGFTVPTINIPPPSFVPRWWS